MRWVCPVAVEQILVPQPALTPGVSVARGAKLTERPMRIVDFLKQVDRDRRIDKGESVLFFELTAVSSFISCADALF